MGGWEVVLLVHRLVHVHLCLLGLLWLSRRAFAVVQEEQLYHFEFQLLV